MMTDPEFITLISASASLIGTIIVGYISWQNRRKTDDNSYRIKDLEGAVNRDLERLKAKLSHGQMVSLTQWNTEFASYQAIWKAIIVVRALATKIVYREDELTELGLPQQYLGSGERVRIRQDLLSKFVQAGQDLLFAIHDNAPFYPAPIREAANKTHQAGKNLGDKYLAVFTHLLRGVDVTKAENFTADCLVLVVEIIQGVDLVESLIRERLAAVQVVNSIRE